MAAAEEDAEAAVFAAKKRGRAEQPVATSFVAIASSEPFVLLA